MKLRDEMISILIMMMDAQIHELLKMVILVKLISWEYLTVKNAKLLIPVLMMIRLNELLSEETK